MNQLEKKPSWLKVKAFRGAGFDRINRLLKERELNTVCQAANCPNRGECFNRGTATFLILGPVCTRNCRFCDVKPGQPAPVDIDGPARVARMARELELRHVVITSVSRDDLPDGGAGQFVEVVNRLRKELGTATVEILTPDFKTTPEVWNMIVGCHPDIFNHNIETVPRLYPEVRPQADYSVSLKLLKYVATESDIMVKSGLMVGMGESFDELQEVFRDLADSGVSLLTVGQYLAPSKDHYPVYRYLHPDEFLELRRLAEQAGIKQVFAAPLVRSSYLADQFAV
jgi:lipoic acid synthetase